MNHRIILESCSSNNVERHSVCIPQIFCVPFTSSALQAACQRPAFLPLVRSHVRGVRYGIARQVQYYLERLSDITGKATATNASKNQFITPDGLFKWTQTYCEAWMNRFSVRTSWSPPSVNGKHTVASHNRWSLGHVLRVRSVYLLGSRSWCNVKCAAAQYLVLIR